MFNFLGSLIGAGTSLFGGLLGQSNAEEQFWAGQRRFAKQFKFMKKTYKDSKAFQERAYRYTTAFADRWAKEAARRNTLSYQMAQARKAGIHPLYALGNQQGFSPPATPTFSGQGPVGGPSPVPATGDGGLASGIAQAGQHLGRAVDAMATHEQRNEARLMSALSIENAGLQNELLRSQIRRMDAQTGPAIPGPGQKYLIDGQGNVVGKTNIDAVTFSQRYPESKQNIQLGPIHQANPYVSNAEDVEARHGELADMLWGAITIPADIYWNYLRDRNKGFDMYGGSGNPIGP